MFAHEQQTGPDEIADRRPRARTRGALVPLIGIVGLAFGMAALGLGYGMPYFSHIDEPHMVERASNVAHGNSLNPGWFGHPASTVIYPLALLYKLHSLAAHGVPPWQPDPAAYATLHVDTLRYAVPEATPYYLLARLVTMAYFVGGVAVTYVLGARCLGRAAGLLAAAMAALSGPLLDYARIARSDTAGMFFTFLVLVACVRILDGSGWRAYLIAGLAVGLAGATRYLCFALGVALVGAFALSGDWRDRRRWGWLAVGLAAIPAAFLLVSPAVPFALRTVYANLRDEARDSSIPIAYGQKLWWYLTTGAPLIVSWPLWLAALAGIALQVRRNLAARLMALTLLVFVLVIAVPRLYHERWVISIAPVLLLFAASALLQATALVGRRLSGPRARQIAGAALVLAVLAAPLADTARRTYLLTQPDTRQQASEWIAANVPPGARIAKESYAGLVLGPYQVTSAFYLYRLGPFDAALTSQYDYFVATDKNYGRFYTTAARNPGNVAFYAEPIAFYDALFRTELVAEFRPGPWEANGPIVRVYRSAAR